MKYTSLFVARVIMYITYHTLEQITSEDRPCIAAGFLYDRHLIILAKVKFVVIMNH